jgi:starch phosphorylase
MDVGGKMTAGVDLWLNTPQFPLEASGTSGMKAALNGVPSLSILDGWWVEGHIEGVTGWAIGELRRGLPMEPPADDRGEAESLYHKLESAILPAFYNERRKFIEIMQHAIAVNGSYFNTQRMVEEYIANAYIR